MRKLILGSMVVIFAVVMIFGAIGCGPFIIVSKRCAKTMSNADLGIVVGSGNTYAKSCDAADEFRYKDKALVKTLPPCP